VDNSQWRIFIAFGYLRKQHKDLIITLMKKTIDGINIQALFSRNLKRLRNSAHLSQIGLAAEADLAHNFINDIENGKKWVSAETIGKLSKALKAEPYEFFLSDSKWNTQVSEMFSLYLDDIEKTQAKMLAEYRNRFLTDRIKDNDQSDRAKTGGGKGKPSPQSKKKGN